MARSRSSLWALLVWHPWWEQWNNGRTHVGHHEVTSWQRLQEPTFTTWRLGIWLPGSQFIPGALVGRHLELLNCGQSATISHNTGMWTCLIIGALVTPILNRSSSSWSLARTWPIPRCSMTPPKSAHQWSSMHSIWPTLGHSHPLVHNVLSSVTVLQRLLIKHCWGDWYLGHWHGWKEVTAKCLEDWQIYLKASGQFVAYSTARNGSFGGLGMILPNSWPIMQGFGWMSGICNSEPMRSQDSAVGGWMREMPRGDKGQAAPLSCSNNN